MNGRQNLTMVLILSGIILLLLPGIGQYSFKVEREELHRSVFEESPYVNVDEVASLLNADDPSLQLIDLRSAEEFRQFSLPGAINVPFEQFFESNPETWLHKRDARTIFYSNGTMHAVHALVLAHGLGYQHVEVMKGGLNEWFSTVMNSRFDGERLSPRENALYENRTKARRFFTEINSLPDSLKLRYTESKRLAARSLDGGCE
jgi:3-mercaptopyruvate sulfurtransferase SseA